MPGRYLLEEFIAGDTRVQVVQDEISAHPWLSNSMASDLACFDVDNASFLPESWDEHTESLLDSYALHGSLEQTCNWLTEVRKSGKPYLIYGINFFDRYGDITLVTDEDVEKNILADAERDDEQRHYDGAIFIDHARFREYVDSKTQMSDDTMIGIMSRILINEFDMLRAYCSGSMYGFITETMCKCCEQWAHPDSVWGFTCLSYAGQKEMFKEMSEHFTDTEDIKAIKVQMGVA